MGPCPLRRPTRDTLTLLQLHEKSHSCSELEVNEFVPTYVYGKKLLSFSNWELIKLVMFQIDLINLIFMQTSFRLSKENHVITRINKLGAISHGQILATCKLCN